VKMIFHGKTLACFCAAGLLLSWGRSAEARQNIVIGEISVRYDHQERNYDDSGLVAERPDGDGGEIVAAGVGDAATGPTVIILEDLRGDRQRYLLTPRLTFSSIGMSDVFEMTYAPSLDYDHLYETTEVDHDFGLRVERNFTRNWLISLNNRFFLGDDPYREDELRTAVIMPETGELVTEEPVVGSPGEESDGTLTEVYGRRRYWTNTLDLLTDYDYGNDRQVSVGYTFDVLRDDSDTVGGYTDYDRHIGLLGLDHRFNRKWRAEGDAWYTRGLFDEPEIIVVTPVTEDTPAEEDTLIEEETVQVDRVAGTGSDDLTEYYFRARGVYDTSPHLHFFTEYSFLATDYDRALLEDYQVNNIALGVDYDINSRLHVTLSGGPSWGSFENSPTESDYNAYAGLTWDYLHGRLTFYADKGYDQENFNGRRSGLTDFWRTGVALDYQLTQDLTATFSASYRDNRRLEYPSAETVVIIDDGTAPVDPLPPEEFDRVEYTEKDYDAGLALTYTFLRWYALSGGYRYYNHDSDLLEGGTGSYDEHRAFIQLAVSKELFRW